MSTQPIRQDGDHHQRHGMRAGALLDLLAPGGRPVDVTTWRRCRLLEGGFDAGVAARLARDSRVDVHALLQLVDRGCPPALAARILAPEGSLP